MRVDRHRDIADDLEAELLSELEGITKQLRGNMTRLTRATSTGRSSKVIEIEYEINERTN
jgi:hypothetical protein